jgi:branched-chain amino acid transport system permease protein
MTQDDKRLIQSLPAIIVLIFLAAAPFLIGTAQVSLLTKIIIFALLGMSLDIPFGYTGLWSFCHAAIFGVAAYTNAILIKHCGVTSFWLAAPASCMMAILISAIFGLIGLRAAGIYFLLITFALGQLVYSVACKWVTVTGGFDGLGGIPYPDIGIFFSGIRFYYFTLVICIVCATAMHYLIGSPFGHSIQGIRERERRMRALGYDTWLHKYLAFVISGLFAGISGILYVHFNGLITPESIGMSASGLVIIMIIIGGTGTLWGAAIGSGIIFCLQYFVSIFTPERWPLILGICFVAAVMLARGGIYVHGRKIYQRIFGLDSLRS